MSQPAMINRYRWYELVGIYVGIFVFLCFILAPFFEGFLVSLKPLGLLFSSPYRFWPENGSFAAYVTMWESVPGFARYIFNSFFISTIEHSLGPIRQCMELAQNLGSPQAGERIQTIDDEHHAIVQAIAEGSPERAEAAMRAHIGHARMRIFEGG